MSRKKKKFWVEVDIIQHYDIIVESSSERGARQLVQRLAMLEPETLADRNEVESFDIDVYGISEMSE